MQKVNKKKLDSRVIKASLVQKATTSEQRVLVGTLESLPNIVEKADIKLSSIIIIGEVVKLHEKLAWFTP